MAESNDAGLDVSGKTLLAIGAGLAGVAVAAVLGRSDRHTPPHVVALRGYLLDHLTGSDAAFGLVTRLRDGHDGTSVGALARRLRAEFRQERTVVEALLREFGASPRSVKRALGTTSSAAAQAFALAVTGGRPLFFALEALAVGVQGKRLLWRALDELALEGEWPFKTLEQQALRQWDEIETMRLVFARAAFGRREMHAEGSGHAR